MNKEVYFLCEGDAIRFIPTGQLGYIQRVHEDSDGTHYELVLSQPDQKIWAGWEDIELLYAVG